MAKKKKRHTRHYCKVCGEQKPNEKFTGKGHAKHICKECWSLVPEVQADRIRCNDVMRLFGKYSFSRKDWELLEKYAKKHADKESGQLAQSILDDRRGNYEMIEEADDSFDFDYADIDSLPDFPEEKKFSELGGEYKALLKEYIRRETTCYWEQNGKAPTDHDSVEIKKRMTAVLEEEYNITLENDKLLRKFFEDNVAATIHKLEKKTKESG